MPPRLAMLQADMCCSKYAALLFTMLSHSPAPAFGAQINARIDLLYSLIFPSCCSGLAAAPGKSQSL